jgi:phage terminase small subunit
MKKQPKPPPGLTPEARQLWTRTIAFWHGLSKEETLLALLRSACGALMRLRSAEAALAKIKGGNGVFLDRWGQPRLHPLHAVIRDSSKQLREDLRALNLDWEALNRVPAEDDPDLEVEEP